MELENIYDLLFFKNIKKYKKSKKIVQKNNITPHSVQIKDK